MFLTIQELRAQIQIAKEQLIESARIWLDSKKDLINEQDKNNWLEALQSSSSDLMQDHLKQEGSFLVRQDRIVSQVPRKYDSEAVESTDQALIVRRVYESVIDTNEVTSGMCQITTLIEQLHHMDDLLIPLESYVQLNPLNLVHEMTVSIHNELRFTEQGLQTVAHYKQRLNIAQQLFESAQRKNLIALEQVNEQLNILSIQFAETLRFFASSLSDIYSSAEDTRFWLIRSLSAYLPWHAMVHQLGTNLFGKDGVIHPDHKLMSIQDQKLVSLYNLFVTDHKNPIDQLQKQHTKLCDEIQQKLIILTRRLDSMGNSLDVRAILSLRPDSGYLLMPKPTELLGMYTFFQKLNAVSRVSLKEIPAEAYQQDSATHQEQLSPGEDEQGYKP